MAKEKEVSEKKGIRYFKKQVAVFWLLFCLPFVLIGLMLLGAAFSDLPTILELEDPKSNLATEVFSSDGKIIGQYYTENRVNVNFSELSPHLTNALVSTEDERYYDHAGVDFIALLRVLKGVVTLNTSQGGGSTISQQLAKMLFSERPRSRWERVTQKFQEWIISVKLERRYTKEEIVSMYLNRFDFINNAVGIKSAANIYFSTTTDSLSLHEAAMLVGMAKNPALYNPLRRPELTKSRRNVVFAQMHRNDALTEQELDSLTQLPLGLKPTKISHIEGLAPYFREVLRQELKNILSAKDERSGAYLITDNEGNPYNIYEDGLKVYTTIDSRLQEYAEFAVREHLSKDLQPQFYNDLEKRARWNKERLAYDWRIDGKEIDKILYQSIRRSDRFRAELNRFVQCEECNPTDAEIEQFKKDSIPVIFDKKVEMTVFSYKGDIDTVMSPLDSIKYYKAFLRAGMVSLDPRTGFVKAWVGGVDYKHFKFDHVKQGKNQVGSTFKPFVYATGIREGLDPCLQVPNTITCFDMPAGQPRYCPKNSDGKYGGMVSLKEGLANSLNNVTAWVMKKYGPEAVAQLAKDLGITTRLDPVPSLCLGVADVNLLEITAANATFANRGVHLKPIFITRIEDKNGNPLYDAIPEATEALDERTSYIMINLLKGVIDQGTGRRLRRALPYGNITYPIAGKTGTTQSNSDGWFIGLTPDLVTGVWVGGEERSIRFASTLYGQGANMALPIWGYYMNRVYRDSDIDISKEDFEAPNFDLGVELDCGEMTTGPNWEE